MPVTPDGTYWYPQVANTDRDAAPKNSWQISIDPGDGTVDVQIFGSLSLASTPYANPDAFNVTSPDEPVDMTALIDPNWTVSPIVFAATGYLTIIDARNTLSGFAGIWYKMVIATTAVQAAINFVGPVWDPTQYWLFGRRQWTD